MNNNMTGYPSIDKPWLKYYNEESLDNIKPECNIYDYIYNNNKDYLNDIALMYQGKKITYKMMFNEINNTAKAFVANGVKSGDNVAVCMLAIPETVYTILALNKIGANVNMLNPTYTPEQLNERINMTQSKLIITLNELYKLVELAIPNSTIEEVISVPAVNSLGTVVKLLKKVKKIDNTIDWNDFIESGRNESDVESLPYEKDKPAIVVYTSGSLGIPKAIQLSNDNINGVTKESANLGLDYKRGDRWFSQIPIWIPTGLCTQTLSPLSYGITVILEPMYDHEILYKHIKKYKPNFLITPRGFVDYLMVNKPKSKIYKNFKHIAVGGEYITPNAEIKYNEWLESNDNYYKIQKGYGMSECSGVVCVTIANRNEIGSSGFPLPESVVSVFDIETGEELKYGEKGELRVLSSGCMLGYYNNQEATDKFYHTDDKGNVWACTGDMGYISENGAVYILGRLKDSYKNSNNETIYLFNIERAILSIDSIRQCKVVMSTINNNITHVAHIVLSDNSNKESILSEIKHICSETLDPGHELTYVKLYDDALPLTTGGKLNTGQMKEDISNVIELKNE